VSDCCRIHEREQKTWCSAAAPSAERDGSEKTVFVTSPPRTHTDIQGDEFRGSDHRVIVPSRLASSDGGAPFNGNGKRGRTRGTLNGGVGRRRPFDGEGRRKAVNETGFGRTATTIPRVERVAVGPGEQSDNMRPEVEPEAASSS